MTAKFLLLRTALAVAACVAGTLPAFANGGDFFEELSSTWGGANADEGVPYFGFVKDTRGKMLGSVSIMATTATGSSFVVQSDNLGHYKIPGFSKSVDPKLVQISCSKTGYKLVSRDRRVLRGVTNAPIETDCVLAPEPAKPTS